MKADRARKSLAGARLKMAGSGASRVLVRRYRPDRAANDNRPPIGAGLYGWPGLVLLTFAACTLLTLIVGLGN